MRIKQTARKSTGTPMRYSSSPASSSDPIQTRMQKLLHTKRKSTGSWDLRSSAGESSGMGKGKRISIYGPDQKPFVKVKPRAKPGENVLRDIRQLQKNYDLLIPRASFHRLIREITQQLMAEREEETSAPSIIRYQSAALSAIQEATEHYLTRLFEDSYLCTVHAKRVTLFVQDMQLCRRLQENRK